MPWPCPALNNHDLFLGCTPATNHQHPLVKWTISNHQHPLEKWTISNHQHPLEKWTISNHQHPLVKWTISNHQHPLEKWTISNTCIATLCEENWSYLVTLTYTLTLPPIHWLQKPYKSSLHLGAGIAQWLERRTRDWKVAGSNPCWKGGRIFFSRVDFLCWLLFRYPFHPRVTTVARKKSRSFCQKCRWQVTAKHAYTLRMWLLLNRASALVTTCP